MKPMFSMKGGMKYERIGGIKKNKMLVDAIIAANVPIKFMSNGCLVM